MTLGNRGPDELPLRIFGKHKYIQEMCEGHVQELERKGLLPKGK